MPIQSARGLHVDQVLTNFVKGRTPPGFIADQLVPILNVSKRSDVYYTTNPLEHLIYVPNMDRMAPGAAPREVFWSVSSDTYYAEKFGLGTYWTVEDEVTADEVLQFDQESANLVTDRLLVSYEMRIAGLVTSANVSTVTHVATAWSNHSAARPYDDLLGYIEDFRNRTMLRPNVAVIPEQVATHLRRSDQIRDLLFGDNGGIASDEQLASLFKVNKILIPETFVNTAGPAETSIGSGTLSAAWPNKVLLAYVAPAAGRKVDTWVQAFRWTDPRLATPFAIQRAPYDTKRDRQDIFAKYYQGEKIISKDLATIIDSVT